MQNTYFDNGATSFPKPAAVATNIAHYLTDIGGTYGRSAYQRVLESTRMVESVRDLMAVKLGTGLSDHIIFTSNATSAINTILFGLNLNNCHILISPLEHNAVVRTVFELCKRNSITFDILPHKTDGLIDVKRIRSAIQKNTRLLIINHQSNVNGLIQPIQTIKKEIPEIPMLIDLAQSAGHIEICLDKWGVEYASFTGHKGLLGPTGTGGFFIRNTDTVTPFLFGGTGSKSEFYEMPSFLPDKYEAGTPNVAGLFGLHGALQGIHAQLYTKDSFVKAITEIERIPYLRCIRAEELDFQGPLFSLIHSAYDCSTFANALYTKFQIETRAGLHCAPLAHKTLRTYPEGTVRISLSPYHTDADLQFLIDSLHKVEHI